MRSSICVGTLLWVASLVDAHVTMWNKGLFGYNYPGQAGDEKQNWNNNWPVVPLRKKDNLTEEQWFAHGLKSYPPKNGDYMELVSGSDYTAELGCNRGWTSMRHPGSTDAMQYYACPPDQPDPEAGISTGTGALHTMNKFNQTASNEWFGGTAIGIAYTSDENSVEPTDFTIIAVNYSSVWTRETIYQIPSAMPKCGNGGCLCTWNWIHLAGNGEGYGDEIYNTLYRCTVSGRTNDTAVLTPGNAAVPSLCENQACKCVRGPKQAIYVFQKEGNNIKPDPTQNPTYNQRYGFADGAQLDIFQAIDGAGQSSMPSTYIGVIAMTALVVALTSSSSI